MRVIELPVAQGGSLLLEWNNCVHGCLPCLIHIYSLAHTHTHTHVRTSTCMMPQCTSSQKEHPLPVFYNVMVSHPTAQPHQSHGATTLSFCSASYQNTNYEKSLFVPPQNQKLPQIHPNYFGQARSRRKTNNYPRSISQP